MQNKGLSNLKCHTHPSYYKVTRSVGMEPCYCTFSFVLTLVYLFLPSFTFVSFTNTSLDYLSCLVCSLSHIHDCTFFTLLPLASALIRSFQRYSRTNQVSRISFGEPLLSPGQGSHSKFVIKLLMCKTQELNPEAHEQVRLCQTQYVIT